MVKNIMHYFKYLLIVRLYVLCIEIVLRILFLAIQNEFKSVVSLNEAVAISEATSAAVATVASSNYCVYTNIWGM